MSNSLVFGRKLACIAEHQAFLTNMIGTHLVLSGSGTTTRIIVKQGWFRDFNVIKFMQMSKGRFPFAVRSFVLAHEKERFVRIPVFQPGKCLICDDICGVTDMVDVFPIGKKHGVVYAPSFQNLEMIETCRSRFKMPFSHYRGLVPCLFRVWGRFAGYHRIHFHWSTDHSDVSTFR